MALELLGVEALLTVTSEDRFDGGIATLDSLKGSQNRVHPLLG
jgi:hypothetical protein